MVTRYQVQDLYTKGVDFVVPREGEGEPWKMHMRKMNPQEQQRAVRGANAARIRLMKILDRDPVEDDDRLILEESVKDIGSGERDDLIDFLIAMNHATRRIMLEQEIAAEDEWAKDDRLQALTDAWDAEMQIEFSKGEEERSTESQELFDQLGKYSDQVEDKLDGNDNVYRDELEVLNEDDLSLKVMRHILERDAGVLWMKVFRDYQILYGCEDRESKECLYDDIKQIASIPPGVYAIYLKAITDVSLPVVDLKS